MEDLQKLEQDILKRIRKDSAERSDDPIAKLESNSDKALKYSELLYRIKNKLIKAKSEKTFKYSELYKKAKWDNTYLLKTKQDVDAFIESNVEYVKIYKVYKEIENIVEILQNMVDIYKQREATERLIFKHNTGVN